jgi:hypothetical protein
MSTVTINALIGATGGVPGVGTFTTPDYTAELVAMASEIAALNASIATINTALLATNAALTTISADMALLLQYLTTVQTPTGEFRTFDFNSIPDTTLVTSALAKTGIPVPPNPGI